MSTIYIIILMKSIIQVLCIDFFLQSKATEMRHDVEDKGGIVSRTRKVTPNYNRDEDFVMM